jgi:predicted MFS family arabinose efflux permease
MSAISPSLVPREDLPGAISLFSFQMNMSRVIGPVIGQVLYAGIGAAAVFAVNALTYLFAIYGLLAAKYPRRVGSQSGTVAGQMVSGFKIAWNDPLIRRIMFILWTMSLLSLNFISFMPKQATANFHINPKTQPYGVLYASFGLGAAAGAMSVGSIFARRDKTTLIRPALVAFGAFLGIFALLRRATPAYPVALLLGYSYFVVITSLSTVLQAHIPDAIRGRVMALWIMGFGGAVGIAALVLGPLAERNISGLLFAGALWLLALALVAGPDKLRAKELRNA